MNGSWKKYEYDTNGNTISYEDRTLNLRDKFDAGYLAEYVTLKVGQEISVIYEEDLPAEYLLRKLWNTN